MTAFTTVCMPYCSTDGTTARSWVHSLFPLVDDVANVLRAVDCSPNCSFLRSSTGFTTVCMPYCLTDGSLDRFFFCSSTAFPTVCMLYCSAYGTTARLWVHSYLLLVDDFANVPRAVDCSPDRSFFRSSTAFTTVYMPYCSADGSGLLILPLVNGFHNGSHTVFLSGWQRIAHSSARQRLSQRFARCIAQRMAVHCSFFRSSTAFTTVFAPYCSADGSGLLILPLVNGFRDTLRAVLLSGRLGRWHYCSVLGSLISSACR